MTCPDGSLPCDGQCPNYASDVAHCGGCNNVCPTPANATATCNGSCGFTCRPGFSLLNGKCASFGGAFSQTYGPWFVCDGVTPGNNACRSGNPFAGGACGCPPGFDAWHVAPVLDDVSCGNGYGWRTLYTCVATGRGLGGDFGGTYWREGASCQYGNPFGGGCSCPAGYTTIEMPFDGSCWARQHMGVCLDGNAARTTFAGAYAVSDIVGYGPCLAGNPASGGCACPGGTSSIPIRSIFGPPNQCDDAGQFGANLFLCFQ